MNDVKNDLRTLIGTLNDKRVITDEQQKQLVQSITNILAENKKGIDTVSAETKGQLEKDAEAKALAEQEAEKLAAEKLAAETLAKQIKKECTDPINSLKQDIVEINEQHAIELAKIKAQPGETPLSIINSQIGKLNKETELNIEAVNTQITNLQLDCAIKYQ